MVKELTIKEAIQFKEAELEAHEKAINEIKKEIAVLKKAEISVLNGIVPQKEDTEYISDNTTIAVKITNILKEADEFLLAKELLVRFNIKYPQKTYNIDSFASALSKNHKKPNNDLCLLEVEGVPMEIRNNYGLKQWLIDEKTPKEEYIQKLKRRNIWH